jgi:hypothetical protein
MSERRSKIAEVKLAYYTDCLPSMVHETSPYTTYQGLETQKRPLNDPKGSWMLDVMAD